ncbi:DNA modification methylase [[Clostridium] sordellii]|uniref:DNA-methyltransferase n=1 Tax=Paraclostridium sordellii TaxID=1505 RepID=UPI0005E19450|nr:site-specific DNA-methyltransferase [Paeniclostridium sordellii]CEQ01611.1 DNA modification methylase [[Clostridium] sordellii] [Paeniclostridium sordellii]
MELNKIYNMDCLEGMKRLRDKSVDMILCDLPYGQTKNKWDSVIPFDKLWKEYKRIIKDNGVIALFANGMFTAELMLSNKSMWKYNLVWNKVLSSGFLNANRMPLRQHEDICIFYKKAPKYNPQKVKGKPNHSKGKVKDNENNNYGSFDFVDNSKELGDMKHPTSILEFSKPHPSKMIHPTEKSTDICEWLIKSYTDEGMTVLDNCIGSGTTAVAAMNTNRNYIGFELDKNYYNIAMDRIKNVDKI